MRIQGAIRDSKWLEARWAVEGHGFAIDGMGKGDALGVEHQAAGGGTIQSVANDGTVKTLEM